MDSFLKIKNKNTIIFLISIGISTFMWLLIKLSKEYEIIVNIPVEYENMPADKILIKTADSVIRVSLTDNGFDLIGSRIIATTNPLVLNTEKFRIKKLSKGKTKYFVLSNAFYDLLKAKFSSSTKIATLKPDSLILIFEKLASKKVKVLSRVNVELASQYQFSGPLKLSPDSIIIYGSAHQLAEINSLQTIEKEFKELESNIAEKLAIVIPENIRLEDESVKLNIDIEKFTEASVEVPIQTPFNKNKKIKIFPKQVQIKFAISLDDYHQLKADQFTVIGKEDSLSVGKLNISLTKFPEHIRVIDYSPKMAEFIIIK